MNIIKFIFNRNYRRNILAKVSADIVNTSYKVEKEMECTYANINVISQSIAA